MGPGEEGVGQGDQRVQTLGDPANDDINGGKVISMISNYYEESEVRGKIKN